MSFVQKAEQLLPLCHYHSRLQHKTLDLAIFWVARGLKQTRLCQGLPWVLRNVLSKAGPKWAPVGKVVQVWAFLALELICTTGR
jgi:hypothetical protein